MLHVHAEDSYNTLDARLFSPSNTKDTNNVRMTTYIEASLPSCYGMA